MFALLGLPALVKKIQIQIRRYFLFSYKKKNVFHDPRYEFLCANLLFLLAGNAVL